MQVKTNFYKTHRKEIVLKKKNLDSFSFFFFSLIFGCLVSWIGDWVSLHSHHSRLKRFLGNHSILHAKYPLLVFRGSAALSPTSSYHPHVPGSLSLYSEQPPAAFLCH